MPTGEPQSPSFSDVLNAAGFAIASVLGGEEHGEELEEEELAAKQAAQTDMADADLELPIGEREFYLGEVQSPLTRPPLRAATVRAIETAAERDPSTGFPLDANTGEVLTGEYDYGHVYGRENNTLIEEATERGMTQAEFNDWVNSHPEWFQIESVSNNRGGAFEAK